MKILFKQRIAKILLLTLICCPPLLTQSTLAHISYIIYDDYNGYVGNAFVYINRQLIKDAYKVFTNRVRFVVKEDYYNDELLEKLKNPPYSSIYFLVNGYFAMSPLPDINTRHYIHLDIKGDLQDINVLHHYLKFKKEEFVEEAVLYPYLHPWPETPTGYFINGQILYNGEPLSNHLVNVRTTLEDTTNMYIPPIDLRRGLTR